MAVLRILSGLLCPFQLLILLSQLLAQLHDCAELQIATVLCFCYLIIRLWWNNFPCDPLLATATRGAGDGLIRCHPISGVSPGAVHIPCSLLVAPLLPNGVRGQKLEIIQTPESLSVSAGEEITLNCILSGIDRLGDVKWHKGLDRNQPALYSHKEESSPRVTRVVPGSLNDFSITIKNVRPEDAGTYYCVKYRQLFGRVEIKESIGNGTVVSVIAIPSQPFIQGPTSRVESGATVTFKCTSDRFSPRDIAVTWWKDGKSIQPLQTTVLPEGESISYEVLSTVEVQLTKEDVKSQLICQINHNTLRSPLKQSFRLGDVIRVPPNIQVDIIPPPPVQLNNTVVIICNVENFYPNDTTVVWFDSNGKNETRINNGPMTQNWDGTYSLLSSLAVKATEERNLSVFACLVRHNSQPPVSKVAMLMIQAETEEDDGFAILGAGQQLFSSPISLWVGIFLSKIITAFFLLYLFLRKERSKMAPGHTAESK